MTIAKGKKGPHTTCSVSSWKVLVEKVNFILQLKLTTTMKVMPNVFGCFLP